MVLRRSPTLQTLAAFGVVFALQVVGSVAGYGFGPRSFALALPLAEHPWTIVLSVYAHAGVAHLLANSLVLVFVGFLVERRTTALRFHAFFVGTGSSAGVAHLFVTAATGPPAAVIGASGAVFALLGYAATGNRAVAPVLAWVDLGHRVTLVVFALVAVVVVLATAAPDVALVAHFVGLLLGLVAGRLRLLRSGPS